MALDVRFVLSRSGLEALLAGTTISEVAGSNDATRAAMKVTRRLE